MRFWIVFLLFLYVVYPVHAQLIYPEVMEVRPPLTGVVVTTQTMLPPFPEILFYKRLNNRNLENPAIRYTVQNLKNAPNPNKEINDAVHTLLRYTENDRLKGAIKYLQNYIQQNMEANEYAIHKIQEQVTYDSLQYAVDDSSCYVSDMQTLVQYINVDTNYQWLKKISRDSVYMEIYSLIDHSVCFWMNNGKMSFHRFWAGTKQGDTIGTWVQVLPYGNQLRFYVDEDVYQASAIEKKSVELKQVIKNTPEQNYFALDKLHLGELRRRYWTYYSEVEVAMSQGKLANWASGGENSLSLLSNLRYYWNYNYKKTSWENWVHYRFGFMKNGSEEIRKNDDRFELNSKLGQRAFSHWYYTAQFNVMTQLFNSYEFPKDQDRVLVANFMSPGYFTLSLGIDYKPHNNFSLVISPIAGKWNFVRDTTKVDAQRYGISEVGKRFKRETGVQIDLISKLNSLFHIMDMTNELKVFMSYENKDRYINKGQEDERKKHIPLTANWKLTLNFKINYFMSASIYTETIYDENYSRKLQFKENLNLGIKFRF